VHLGVDPRAGAVGDRSDVDLFDTRHPAPWITCTRLPWPRSRCPRESSSERRLVSSASSRLPQWQRPVSGASLRDVSRPLIAPLALDLAPVPPREVDDLELHPVRIGEEDRVVLRAVL